jgi:hypothetical protein
LDGVGWGIFMSSSSSSSPSFFSVSTADDESDSLLLDDELSESLFELLMVLKLVVSFF